MENNGLIIFKNDEFGEIRSFNIDNEPWFIAKDICEILDIKNTTQAVGRLDEDERTMLNIGRQGSTNCVNEYGLYNLILVSRKAEASAFKRWITHEVIPSIRKNGGYIANQENISDDEYIARALVLAERKINEKEQILLQKEAEIREMKPKARYLDLILQSPSTMTVTSIAKDYGMTAIEMNQLLHELGIQYKQSQQWFLFAKYQREGYTHGKSTPFYRNDGRLDYKINTEWTQKGRLFLYEILKENGYVPLIEREVEDVKIR